MKILRTTRKKVLRWQKVEDKPALDDKARMLIIKGALKQLS